MKLVTHSRHPDHASSQTRALCGWFHRPQFTEQPEDEPTCQNCQKLRLKDRLEKIELTWRALFRYPKQGPINPAGFRVPGGINIEIYRSTKRPVTWEARNVETKHPFGLGQFLNVEDAQGSIAAQFEEQLSHWRPFSEGEEIEAAAVTITPEGHTFLKLKWNSPKAAKVTPILSHRHTPTCNAVLLLDESRCNCEASKARTQIA